ncbi:hypothetical protein HMPREF1255_1732 [Propionimicrobium sp. BV2F7]|nr:hypothetical protein HMPREF1255_1732 [Propionimicrobium sp. BV2F7]
MFTKSFIVLKLQNVHSDNIYLEIWRCTGLESSPDNPYN